MSAAAPARTIDGIIDGIIAVEGGFVDHPADRGGATKYGITEAVARANGWNGTMQAMPVSFARHVYLQQYVVRPQFDRVGLVSMPLATELVDTGVNMGPAAAARFLQRALNAFNRQRKLYADLKVDGYIGDQTIVALQALLKARGAQGELVLLRALNALQGARYIELAEGDQTQEEFTFGWFAERVEIVGGA